MEVLDKIKEYWNKLISRFNKDLVLASILSTLKLGNGDINQYYDIINPNKVKIWELHKKLKGIKDNNPNLHKKFIISLGEIDENGEPRYKNIIEDTYRKIGNRNKDIKESEKDEAKKLLGELKQNSMNIFKSLIQELGKKENKNMKISGFRISTLIKILRGDSFCFNTTEDSDPKYIQFDKYAGGKVVKQVLQYENSQEEEKDVLISRRHVSEGADLDKMRDCLIKYKKFIYYYLKEVKPYVASETWLNDTAFFEHYAKYLSDKGRNPEDQKTIRNLNLTRELSIGDIELLPFTENSEDYEKRREKFIKKKSTSSLSIALNEYEKLGNRLQKGKTILDLNELK